MNKMSLIFFLFIVIITNSVNSFASQSENDTLAFIKSNHSITGNWKLKSGKWESFNPTDLDTQSVFNSKFIDFLIDKKSHLLITSSNNDYLFQMDFGIYTLSGLFLNNDGQINTKSVNTMLCYEVEQEIYIAPLSKDDLIIT